LTAWRFARRICALTAHAVSSAAHAWSARASACAYQSLSSSLASAGAWRPGWSLFVFCSSGGSPSSLSLPLPLPASRSCPRAPPPPPPPASSPAAAPPSPPAGSPAAALSNPAGLRGGRGRRVSAHAARARHAARHVSAAERRHAARRLRSHAPLLCFAQLPQVRVVHNGHHLAAHPVARRCLSLRHGGDEEAPCSAVQGEPLRVRAQGAPPAQARTALDPEHLVEALRHADQHQRAVLVLNLRSEAAAAGDARVSVRGAAAGAPSARARTSRMLLPRGPQTRSRRWPASMEGHSSATDCSTCLRRWLISDARAAAAGATQCNA